MTSGVTSVVAGDLLLASDRVLASHPIITAVPFFVPTFVVAGVIGFVIWRDRRRHRGGDSSGEDS